MCNDFLAMAEAQHGLPRAALDPQAHAPIMTGLVGRGGCASVYATSDPQVCAVRQPGAPVLSATLSLCTRCSVPKPQGPSNCIGGALDQMRLCLRLGAGSGGACKRGRQIG